MRKEEEYITNKKRFFDEFSDPAEDNTEENKDAETGPKGGLNNELKILHLTFNFRFFNLQRSSESFSRETLMITLE
jgi:hypothetical protein